MTNSRRAAIALFVFAPLSAANTILSTTSGSRFITSRWQNGQAGPINNSPGPYFDIRSDDGPSAGTSGCNIGFYLYGPNSGCSTTYQPGGVDRFAGPDYRGPAVGRDGADFWSAGSATAADVSFNFTSDSPYFTVELMAAAAGNSAINQLGVYTLDDDGSIYQTLVLLSGQSLLQPVTFAPGDHRWGFFLNNGTTTYYMDSSLNAPGDPRTQHFAVFRDPTDVNNDSANNQWQKLWIGIEDINGSPDYNDLILRVGCLYCGTGSVASTPEVSTGWLVAGGCALLGISRWKRRKRTGPCRPLH